MSSRAKFLWDTRSRERLDKLERIHAEVRGPGPGRRWYTSELNRSLFVALVAQFQFYCRTLHDQAVDVYVSEADTRMALLLRRLMTDGRKLDMQNPRGGVLGSDFAKVGLALYPALKQSGAKVESDLKRLEILIDLRNAVTHGNDGEVKDLEAGGEIKVNLQSYRVFRKDH